MFKHVLALSPHTDDVELGAGGTLNRLLTEGAEIDVIAFSTCNNEKLINEFQNSINSYEGEKIRGSIYSYIHRDFPRQRQQILDQIIELRNNAIKTNYEYDLVLVPSTTDVHQDHQVVTQETIRAFKSTTTILGYEEVWNNINFSSQLIIKLTYEDIKAKLKALQHYKSQYQRKYFWNGCTVIEGLSQVRGLQVNHPYAEAFEIIRFVI